jgi:hypothetical protein
MHLHRDGLVFKAKEIGPMSFYGLRQTDYGEGFRMPTFSEIIKLTLGALENIGYDTAKNVIRILESSSLTGNTGVLYVPEGMWVQDNPRLEDGRIVMDKDELERKLGSRKKRDVVFSKDGAVRFVRGRYDIGEVKTHSQFERNPGIIALCGGEENVERLSVISKHYPGLPSFFALDDSNPHETVTDFGTYVSPDSDKEGVVVDATTYGDHDKRFTFAVKENTKRKK